MRGVFQSHAKPFVLRGFVLALAVASAVVAIATAHASHATFPGADGWIAYLSNGRVAELTPDGSVHRLLPPRRDASRVAWSPDGRRLLVSANEIFVAGADARRLIRLPIGRSWRHGRPDAAWAPNGRAIVFGADSGRTCRSLFTYQLQTKRLARLTYGCGDAFPAWSPDARAIAYAAGNHICILSLRTRRARCVARGLDPSWSPDGRRLAYAYRRAIHLRSVESGSETLLQLTSFDPQETVSAPAWSPDGQRLAFIRNELGAKYERHLYVVNIDGTGLRKIGSGVLEDRPDWQPVRRAPSRTSARR